MKIKIAKIVFLVVCIGTFLFLLLPFLETTRPADPSQLKAQPQVATDNPLTAIARRLRTLFGGKERTARRLSGSNPAIATRPTDEFLAAAAPTRVTWAQEPLPAEKRPTPGIVSQPQEPVDFGDAAIQTDAGEWVLIRQTAPQSGQPGMHEVNVHDNPYDRYVKQERAQRALASQPKPEIPDSKWARLVRPVKRFFGLDTPAPVTPSAVEVHRMQDPHANSLASAKDKNATGSRYPSMGPVRLPWPDISPKEWTLMTPEQRRHEQERRSVARFADLLSGERAAQEAAEIAADSKYPNPKNDKEKREKEEYQAQLIEQNKEKIKNGILQVMQQNAADKEPVDELSFMTGCTNASLPKTTCNLNHDDSVLPAPADQIEQEQSQNSQTFFEKTGYELPKNLPLTIVLSPTTPETISQMAQIPSQEAKQAAEIYEFLYEKQQCNSNTCYWVANSKQKDPQLTDAVSMTNAQLKPDPQNTYPGYKQAFIEYKLSQLSPQATPEEQAQVRQTAQKQFEENAVHYVPYTPKQLKEIQTQTLAAANPANKEGKAQDLTIFYMTDPAQASQFAQDIDSVIFGYGQISLSNANSASEAAQQIISSTAQNVNDAKEVISNQVTKPATSSAITQTINEQIRQQNQSGAGWEGIFNATKNLGNPSQPKAPKK